PPTARVVQNAQLPISAELGVIEAGDHVFAFSAGRVAILRDGAVVRELSARWASPTALVAPEHAGTWVVALADGELVRVLPDADPEPLGVRLGVGADRVLAIDGAGTAFVAGLAGGVAASSDGEHVKRFAGEPVRQVAAGRHKVAVGRAGRIEVLDLEHGAVVTFPLQGEAERIAFLDPEGPRPRLVIHQGTAVFLETGRVLERVQLPPVQQIAPAGARLWIRAGDSLYIHDGRYLRLASATVGASAKIFGSSSGDVWIAEQRLVRYTLDTAADETWTTTVAPVFERGCARCHRPGGKDDSGVDLTRASRWRALRSEIIRRVLVEGDMPPTDAEPLTVTDRRVLERWLAPR
ncbi:MAG TPA: hypothetical protein VIU61_14840, partial [Kofleriaceae bacterium]